MILSPLWLPITLAAALFQCWRTAMQQKLRGQLSVNAAAVVRYLYGVPVGVLLLALYLAGFGGGLPAPSWGVVGVFALGGVGEILRTNLLIIGFGPRGLALRTPLSQTQAGAGGG